MNLKSMSPCNLIFFDNTSMIRHRASQSGIPITISRSNLKKILNAKSSTNIGCDSQILLPKRWVSDQQFLPGTCQSPLSELHHPLAFGGSLQPNSAIGACTRLQKKKTHDGNALWTPFPNRKSTVALNVIRFYRDEKVDLSFLVQFLGTVQGFSF